MFWIPCGIDGHGNYLHFGFIAGFRVERLTTKNGMKFSIGSMSSALIKFESEKMLYKFLTV